MKQPITHLQVAEAQLKIDSAELHLYRAVDILDDYSKRGQKLTQAKALN